MFGSIENTSFSLNLRSFKNHNSFDSSIYVVEAEDLLMPAVIKRYRNYKWLTVGVSWISVLIGSYFRLIMYQYVIEQYKKKELTPVNKLNLVVALVQHLHQVVSALSASLMILYDDSLDHVFGGLWYCYFATTLTTFGIGYSCIGSLGVSIYRILLIKQNYWLKYVVGEKVMTNFLLFGGVILNVIILVYFNSHDFNQLRHKTCMMVHKLSIYELLDEYEQSRGNSSPLSHYRNVIIVCLATLILATISEIIIYVIFFHDMYKHNNSDRLRSLIGPSVIRYRNRSNAISFFGQFCSFACELTLLILFFFAIQFGTPQNILHTFAITFWRLKFSAMAMIEVLTSNTLRARLIQTNLFDTLFRLN